MNNISFLKKDKGAESMRMLSHENKNSESPQNTCKFFCNYFLMLISKFTKYHFW